MKNLMEKLNFSKNKKRFLIFFIFIILVLILLCLFFKKNENQKNIIIEIKKGTITQEILETGKIKKGEEINLSFKNAGKIEKIYVNIGDFVKTNQNLAKLDNSLLSIQLKEAQANLEAQIIKLEELKKGTRLEEISISENLLKKAKEELNNLYQQTPSILTQSFSLTDNSVRNTISPLFIYRYLSDEEKSYYELTYRYCNDSAGNDAKYQRKLVDNYLQNWSKELDNIQNYSTTSLEVLISKSEGYLKNIQGFLKTVSDSLVIDCPLAYPEIENINNYKLLVSQAITNISSALNSLKTHQGAIENQKILVRNYQEELNLKLSGPTSETIKFQEAQVKLAESRVELLEKQIEDSILKSPIEGQVIDIKKKVGEIIQPGFNDTIIVILPTVQLELVVDIYEEDVTKIKINDPVEISLIAFPEKIFKGEVLKISPSSKIIDGVVYYEVTIIFDEDLPAGVKPGMTADIKIITAKKDNVLFLSEDAIYRKENKQFVQVYKNGKIEEREITTGLKSSEGLVEIISGLKEGEKVIIKTQ